MKKRKIIVNLFLKQTLQGFKFYQIPSQLSAEIYQPLNQISKEFLDVYNLQKKNTSMDAAAWHDDN
jgi:Fe-S cluster biosynthesis and repair protein YggX